VRKINSRSDLLKLESARAEKEDQENIVNAIYAVDEVNENSPAGSSDRALEGYTPHQLSSNPVKSQFGH